LQRIREGSIVSFLYEDKEFITLKLKEIFPWNASRPLLFDRLFALPKAFFPLSFPSWETIFPRQQPIYIEYCTGNGHWLCEKALQHPEINWVGVEKQFERVSKIWSKMKRAQLDNLFIIYGEAELFSHYAPKGAFQQIFMNFPDPWPKRKHHKHRLIQSSFIQKLSYQLIEGGKFTFVTDDHHYLEWTLRLLLEEGSLRPLEPFPHYVNEMMGYGSSTFEALWREKKRTIYYLPCHKPVVEWFHG